MNVLRDWWQRLAGAPDETALPLYHAVVATARAPHWYQAGGVPDTVDGRFEMVAVILSLVLLRLEDATSAKEASARLTERFVDDMDGQLREIGIGDITVGKHIGKMMSMLGGRLGAYRAGLAGADLAPALLRNLYRGISPGAEALGYTAGALARFAGDLRTLPVATVLDGRLS